MEFQADSWKAAQLYSALLCSVFNSRIEGDRQNSFNDQIQASLPQQTHEQRSEKEAVSLCAQRMAGSKAENTSAS